jgi:tellurite resistance protein
LTLNRLLLDSTLPDALVPSVTFEAAPAALAGTAYFELHGPVPDPVAYGLTGYLVLLVLVKVRLLPAFRLLTFTPGFWSFTFPWSVIASFTLTWLHIERPPGQRVYAALVLAAVTLLIGAIAVRSLAAVAHGEFLPGPDAAPPVPGLGLPSFQRRPGEVDRLTSGRPAPNGTRSADPAPHAGPTANPSPSPKGRQP